MLGVGDRGLLDRWLGRGAPLGCDCHGDRARLQFATGFELDVVFWVGVCQLKSSEAWGRRSVNERHTPRWRRTWHVDDAKDVLRQSSHLTVILAVTRPAECHQPCPTRSGGVIITHGRSQDGESACKVHLVERVAENGYGMGDAGVDGAEDGYRG